MYPDEMKYEAYLEIRDAAMKRAHKKYKEMTLWSRSSHPFTSSEHRTFAEFYRARYKKYRP